MANTTSKKTTLSVPVRLNILNSIVLLSGLLSVFGAYEIQLGGTMHKLNFLHSKYTHLLSDQTIQFESGANNIDEIRKIVKEIHQQPTECLNITNKIDRFVMGLLKTVEALNYCQSSANIATRTLIALNDFERGQIDRPTLIMILNKNVADLLEDGHLFEPLIDKTVKFVFFSIFALILTKAIIVTLFGIYLSTGVAKDYKVLALTKDKLIQETKRNDIIQEEKMASMSTMVAGLAHEINTPLGIAVTASTHMNDTIQELEKRYTAGTISQQDIEHFFSVAHEANNILDSNLKRSSDLISSFKMVAVDQSTDDERTINLKTYLDDVLLSLSPKVRRTGHTIKLNCPENLIAMTYPGALSQVVTNLITNSLLHAFPDKSNGAISISVNMPSPDSIQLVYEDNGIGIPEENLNRVFDAFFTTKRGSGGTGLGLHILHNLITQKLEGTITCESKTGLGTKFFISWKALPDNIHDQTNSKRDASIANQHTIQTSAPLPG